MSGVELQHPISSCASNFQLPDHIFHVLWGPAFYCIQHFPVIPALIVYGKAARNRQTLAFLQKLLETVLIDHGHVISGCV